MRWLDMCLATAAVALWGINFVAAKFGMMLFPPFFLTAIRFLLVAIILVPFFPRPDRESMIRIFHLSIALGALHFPLLFAALWHGLDIATGTILTQLGVPFSCALGAIFFKDHLGMWRTMGMIVAFTGVVLVAGTPMVSENYIGFLLALGGAFAWGVANILMKRIGDVHIFTILGWMAMFSVPQLLLISFIFEDHQLMLLTDPPAPSILGLLYTVVFSTLVAYGMWYSLLKRYDISQVAPFALMTPFFGIAAGQLFFIEALTWQVIIGGLITMVGVGIIVLRRPKIAMLGEGT